MFVKDEKYLSENDRKPKKGTVTDGRSTGEKGLTEFKVLRTPELLREDGTSGRDDVDRNPESSLLSRKQFRRTDKVIS